METVNVQPIPSLWTPMMPWCASTNPLAMASYDAVGFVATRCEHDDRYWREGAVPPAHFEAVDSWQHEIEDEQIGGNGDGASQGARPVAH